MTLAQLGVMLWHDLAAPLMVSLLASMIVSWWRNRR